MSATELAQAIVAGLNSPASPFALPFVAEWRVVPFERIEELATVKVSVFNGTKKVTRTTRQEWTTNYKPVVAIQKRLAGKTESERIAECQVLIELCEAIETALIADYSGYSFVGFDQEQDRDVYGLEALRNLGCFVNAITLEYELA